MSAQTSLVALGDADQRLAVLRGAIDALARCTTLDEAKGIADKAAAAVVWARKAKLGLEAQNHAAEIKLRAERRAGEILKSLEPTQKQRAGAGRPPKLPPTLEAIPRDPSPYASALTEAQASPQAASRWKQVAAVDESNFERHIAEAKASGEEVTTHGLLRRERMPHVAHNSGNNEWYTPAPVVELARQVLGRIDLDPASSNTANEVVKADRYFTVDDDGLSKQWAGRVWMNPPYESGVVELFSDKLVESLASFDVTAAIVLVNNATETRWFQKMAASSQAVCFPSSRVKFLRPDGKTGAPLQGQAILYFGDDGSRFREAFAAQGVTYAR